ncbi:MAG: hypothetical protein K6E91_07865 [Butyrivibrio sp.]|nr:hypothetical protein [Butyrivibrio sp.]
MKRKVITLILMSAITCCLFSGCGKATDTDLDKNNKVKSEAVGEKEADRKAEEKTEAKSDKKSEEKSEEKPREQSEAESEAESDYEVNYASVLDEVYKVVTAGYDYDKKYKYISDGLMEKCMYPGDKDLSEAVGYILEDISGDDIPELIIGSDEQYGDSGRQSYIYSIFALRNGKPLKVFDGWARSSYRWMGDDHFYYSGSIGAVNTLFGKNHLSKDGSEIIWDDFYFTDEKDVGVIGLYHNTTGLFDAGKAEELSIPEDEFWTIMDDYESQCKLFSWTPIGKYVSKEGSAGAEIAAYAKFLSGYMEHPAMSTSLSEEFGEEDKPDEAGDVLFSLIYLDDDDIPELVLANGTAPWNPVHVFACKDGEVKETGEYSMYGKMYYTPKKGYILPMYYIPVADAEIMIYGSDKTIPFDLDRDSKSFISPADYNSRSLADVKDMEDELARMKESAPLGISAMGAAIIDDSYLTEGVVSFDGKHAGQIPGIWYLQTEDAVAPTWIEFDTNGTFTTHYNEMAGAATGYIRYEQESPILEDGGIYYLYYSDGTRYDAFEIGPDSEHGYMMNFFGRVYYRNQ